MDRRPPPATVRTAAALLRGLGVVYAVAGASLWVQVIGLVGARGILPAAERAGPALSSFAAWWPSPSLLWWRPTDGALRAACAVVVAAGVALAVLPRRSLSGAGGLLAAITAWAGYLSLVTVGSVFLGYQWDALLCESGFLAIWLVRALPRGGGADGGGGGDGVGVDVDGSRGDGRSPTRILWLFRLLVARLLFASGVVKLHGDAVWRDLSALRFHFMTQPLPTVSAWWAHQLPPGILRAMTAAALAIELIAPLLVFGGPRARRVAAAAIVALQLAIAATGNYGFFNLLTIVLCVALLDDDAWRWRWRRRRGSGARSVAEATSTTPLSSDRPPLPRRRRPLEAAVVVLVLWLTAAPLVLAAGWRPPSAVAAPLFAPFVALSSWRIVNPYGLFADMTTTRPELRIEGTADGVAWRPYDLQWLPGDIRRAPRLAGVHMPRLDWQLWFAALQADGGGGAPDWLVRFLDRLKAGEPTVTALLARDPFAGRAPLAVRAVLVQDRFTTVAERRASGAWWVRTGGVTVITR